MKETMSNLNNRITQLEKNHPEAEPPLLTIDQLKERFENLRQIFSDPTVRANVKANAQRYPSSHLQPLARLLELIEIAEKRAGNEQLR